MGYMKNKTLRRMWVLYGAFFSILTLGLALFVSEVLSTSDYEDMSNFMTEHENLNLKTALTSNLENAANNYDFNIPISTSEDSSVIVSARVNEYDILVMSKDEDKIKNSSSLTVLVLQYLSVVCFAVMIVFVFIILYSLYKSIKQGKVFQKKNIRWMRYIGVLLIAMTLSMDIARYLEYQFVLQFLEGTDVVLESRMNIHFTRLLFGLCILFAAEIFKIGLDIQEEQDLTI